MREIFLKEMTKVCGLPLNEAKPFTPEEQTVLYATSYGLYEVGNYDEAANFFARLILADPFVEKYWRGLASCRQMGRKYVEALHAWALSALLDERDPWPHFHAAECLLSIDDKEEAMKALQAAEERLAHAPDEGLKDKIEILKQVHPTSCQ